MQRKVIIWVDPSKKSELRFIGSLIELLHDEMPVFESLRRMLKDISLALVETGWPVEMEFFVKKNISLSVKVKNSSSPESLSKSKKPPKLAFGDQ